MKKFINIILKIFFLNFVPLCLCAFLTSSTIFAIDFNGLQKYIGNFEFVYKTYALADNEMISLFGAKNKNFFDDHWYWGEAGSAAIFGQRSGYLEGGVIFGYQFRLYEFLTLDAQLFAGAGGGGAAQQGGGFLINPILGVFYNFSSQFMAGIEVGYICFLNGKISSPTFALAISYDFYKLVSI